MRPRYADPQYEGVCRVGYKHGMEDMKTIIISEIKEMYPITNIYSIIEMIKKL